MKELLLLVSLLTAKTPAVEERLSLDSSYWVKGMPLTLRFRVPESWQNSPSVTLSLKAKSSASEQSVEKLSPTKGVAELSIERFLGKCEAGMVEINVSCTGETLGPVKLRILEPAKKADFEKATVEQLAATSAVLVTTHGAMLLEFYPDKAPNTVRNFFKLSSKGFYDGSPFHRIIKDFMIQGGDPTGTGMGDAGYKLKAEFNDLEHRKGVISMAREPEPDTASCQFFIVHGEHASHLDRQYTAFGKLLDGREALDRIASVPCEAGDDGAPSRPKEPVVLKKVILVEKPVKSEQAAK